MLHWHYRKGELFWIRLLGYGIALKWGSYRPKFSERYGLNNRAFKVRNLSVELLTRDY